jgi:hypothetical protein
VYFLTLVGFVPAAMAGFAMGKKLQEFDRM